MPVLAGRLVFFLHYLITAEANIVSFLLHARFPPPTDFNKSSLMCTLSQNQQQSHKLFQNMCKKFFEILIIVGKCHENYICSRPFEG